MKNDRAFCELVLRLLDQRRPGHRLECRGGSALSEVADQLLLGHPPARRRRRSLLNLPGSATSRCATGVVNSTTDAPAGLSAVPKPTIPTMRTRCGGPWTRTVVVSPTADGPSVALLLVDHDLVGRLRGMPGHQMERVQRRPPGSSCRPGWARRSPGCRGPCRPCRSAGVPEGAALGRGDAGHRLSAGTREASTIGRCSPGDLRTVERPPWPGPRRRCPCRRRRTGC